MSSDSDASSGGFSDTDSQGSDNVAQDPVVAEYEVFITPALEEHLCVLQYPSRPVYRPFLTPNSGRFKAENKILELTYHHDQDNEHFEMEEAEEMEGVEMSTDCLNKLVLRSNRKRTRQAHVNYAVGIVDTESKRLTLTPISMIYEMNPDLSNLDQAPTVKGAAAAAPAAVTMQPIEVINKRRETERSLAMRQNSYAYLKQQEDAEPWLPLRVVSQTSKKAETLVEQLQAGKAKVTQKALGKQRRKAKVVNSSESSSGEDEDEDEDEEVVQVSSDTAKGEGLNAQVGFLSVTEYLNIVAPEQADYLKETESDSVSTQLPLGKQIKECLCSKVMLKFDDLASFAPQAVKLRKEALNHLQEYAVLVRGVWVVKSVIFFNSRFGTEEGLRDEKSMSLELQVRLQEAPKELLRYDLEPFPWTNVADQMLRSCALRDLILSLFCASKEGAIKRQDVPKLVRVQTQELREVLTGIAVPNKVTKLWHLKTAEDVKFSKQNAKILKLEQEKWKLRKFRALVALGMPVETAAQQVE